MLPPASEDFTRDILSTSLDVDVTTHLATATITLAASDSTGASFEIGDLDISAVRTAGPLNFETHDGTLDVGLPAGETTLTIDYQYADHDMFDGALASGVTFTWPYFCGNLFPCHSDPADGTAFALALSGVPDGEAAIFPAEIPADAPPYMLAWAVGDYTRIELGETGDQTSVSVWVLPGEEEAARAGTAHLVDVFDFYETTYGSYRFGEEVGSVSAPWGPGAYGGMEHHPFWHVASDAMGDEEVHAHEAAHGWFGDGVRIRCWEDFVLSEGTASYLAARALTEVAGTATGDAVWESYERRLDSAQASATLKIAWPEGCGQIDIIQDGLFTDIPYMKGALFYRALAARVGEDELDNALRVFYGTYRGSAAGMQDLLDVVATETGYDPTECADAWLRSADLPAGTSICPSVVVPARRR